MIARITDVVIKRKNHGEKEYMELTLQSFDTKGKIDEGSCDQKGKLWTSDELWNLWHMRYHRHHWVVWDYNAKDRNRKWWIFTV